MVDAATKRWTKTRADEIAVSNGCRFNEAKGQHVVDFFYQLRHTTGEWAGESFGLMDWQRDEIVMPLFGWEAPDGTRRYRIAYVEVPKKSGKSTMCSAIALYLLAGDGEPGSQVYCAASDRNQASIVYREASAMARGSPLLRDYIKASDSLKNLALPSSNSFLRVISADAFRAEGLNAHGVIFDELHAQRTRDLWDALRYSGAARKQPLLVSITTAGYDRESICFEQHARARQVIDGIIEDDSFFPYIRCAEETDDWTSPEVWKKANPSLGVTVNLREFTEAFKEAQESPARENSFKRYRLNIWTEQDVRWLPMDKWDACDGEVDLVRLRGKECFAGLDLSSTTDVSALSLVFPQRNGYAVLPFFWIPADNARKRERRDRVPYTSWARQGHLEMTPGNVVDYDVIRHRINELGREYAIKQIAVDRWNATQITTQLTGDGFEMIAFGQGFASMSAPSKELEKLVLGGNLVHGDNPVLRWMASNAAAEVDAAGNLKPTKKKSRDRIDGVVATIMGLGIAMVAAPRKRSVYETRGILYL